VGLLSTRLARGLESLVAGAVPPTTSDSPSAAVAVGGRTFVGITGLNTVEWACADFATALSGCVSVGVHTTSTTAVVQHIVANSGMAVLMLHGGKLTAQGNGGSWSLQSLLTSESALASLQHIVVLDLAVGEIVAALCASAVPCTHTPGSAALLLPHRDGLIRIHSALEWAGGAVDHVSLRNPDSLPIGGRSELVTLLYTSGSSGPPKGVMVTAESFVNDISQKSFVEPLVTASYIPLSHSSDRLKMWEFLMNGGRVGFAYFPAVNWLSHELDKKAAMVQTTSAAADLMVLFTQVLPRLLAKALLCFLGPHHTTTSQCAHTPTSLSSSCHHHVTILSSSPPS
jgi:hypothetical protein